MTQSIRLKRLTAVKPEAQAISRLEQNVDQAVRDVDEAKSDRPTVRGLVTSDYKAKVGEFVAVNPESGALNVMIPRPDSADNGRTIHVANVSASTNVITFVGVDCLINGQANATISSAYATGHFIAFNGNWFVF